MFCFGHGKVKRNNTDANDDLDQPRRRRWLWNGHVIKWITDTLKRGVDTKVGRSAARSGDFRSPLSPLTIHYPSLPTYPHQRASTMSTGTHDAVKGDLENNGHYPRENEYRQEDYAFKTNSNGGSNGYGLNRPGADQCHHLK
ncbi:unnamed protein product [Zymoseptoria tritici ST99CH_1A5]|uniref:Uncharacterized protein n=1 Tax=Zymoseptoria tritici ST99CH_1A5 TaxID=1276529 RepID=A0A1Y6LX82_ZYMTR|nr:unnamed protein product [Zymoseptoria tritici ST99CH_1A5]